MNIELPNRFCPNTCLFKAKDFQEARASGQAFDVCSKDCYHKDDVEEKPSYPITVYKYGHNHPDLETLTVVGHNGDVLYTEYSDGRSAGGIHRNAPFIVKR